MTRFASASGPAKAGMIAGGIALVLFLFVALWLLITMAGLGLLEQEINWFRVPAWLWYVRENPRVDMWLKIGAGVSFTILSLFGLAIAMKRKKPLHGDARWANESEIRREGMRAETGIILGRKGGSYLTFGGSEHVMLYAPTRSGKGVGVVIPNLLNWSDSVVCLDIKKENWDTTAGFRAAHGQQVVLFDPLDKEGRTARYNPLGYINRADRIEVLDELQKVAAMLFPPPEKGDPFWSEASRTGFMGVGAYVAETPDLAFTIGEIYRQLTKGDPKTRLPAEIKARAAAGVPLSNGCENALTDFCSASDNTFASIKQTITSRMGLWLNPRIDAATATSDFDLREIRSRRMSIFLGTEANDMQRIAPLYNLFFQQLVDLNTRDLPTDKHPYKVLVLLDEFARLGNASVIAHGFSYVAGYGLRFLPVLQSPSQLRTAYGPDMAEEIMTNCGVEILFTPKELKIATELSERLGYYDFKAQSKSRPTVLGGGKRTTSTSDQKRALMLPQELMQMSKDALILMRGGIPAVKGEKITFYNNKDFTSRLKPAPIVPPRPLGPGIDMSPDETSVAESLAGLRADMTEVKSSIGEIHQRVIIERRMTAEEAAGVAPLDYGMISLALEDADLEPPPEGASEDDFEAWTSKFVDISVIQDQS